MTNTGAGGQEGTGIPTRQAQRAQLSSTASSLEEMIGRVSVAADAVSGDEEDLAADLYEVERSLRTAARRLASVLRRLDCA